MFSVGLGELLVVITVALLVIKPCDLPKVSREIGFQLRKLQGCLAISKQYFKKLIFPTEIE